MAQTAQSRQLLLFGKEGYFSLVQQQLDLLDSAAKGVKERDIVVKVVDSGDALHSKYKVPAASFQVILVGKDGGEKHRSKRVMTMQELFALIDAMPMRQSEMKQRR